MFGPQKTEKMWAPSSHGLTKPLFVGQMANEMATNSADQPRPYWKLKREIWLVLEVSSLNEAQAASQSGPHQEPTRVPAISKTRRRCIAPQKGSRAPDSESDGRRSLSLGAAKASGAHPGARCFPRLVPLIDPAGRSEGIEHPKELEQIPVMFEHSRHDEKSSCILAG
jgi:hypothetical protein